MTRFEAVGRRLVRFSSVGAVTGALYVVIVAALVDLAHLGPKAASVCAYLAALPVSFIANRQFTFRSTGPITHELPRFVLVHCANIGVSVAAMWWASVSGFSHWIGSLLALPLVPLSTFAMMEIWVFAYRQGSMSASHDSGKMLKAVSDEAGPERGPRRRIMALRVGLSDPAGRLLALTAATFMVMSVTMTALVASCRIVMGEPGFRAIALTLLLSTAVISSWLIAGLYLRTRGRSIASASLAAIAVLALPVLVGKSLALSFLVILVFLTVCALAAILVLPAILREESRIIVAVLALGTACGAIFFLWMNTIGYAHVYAPEAAMLGRLHRDTLYHASIANMLVYHGVVSTGLDGLVRITYHVLSHLWVGNTSVWLGTTSLNGYYLLPQIVIMPVLLMSAVMAAVVVGAGAQDDAARERASVGFPEIVLLPLALLLFVAIWDFAFFASESHTLAIIAFLMALPLLFEQSTAGLDARAIPRLILIALAGLLMSLSKVSVGALWFLGAGYIVLRQLVPRLSLPVILGAALLCAAGVYLLTLILPHVVPVEHARDLAFKPFAFTRYAATAWINTVAVGAGGFAALAAWYRGDNRAVMEACILIMGVAWLIAMMIFLEAGAGWYFLNVAAWLAIVLVSREVLYAPAAATHSIALCGLAVLTILFALVKNPQTATSVSLLKGLVARLAADVGAPDPNSVFASRAIAEGVQSAAGARMRAGVLADFAFGEPNAALVVPGGNADYWGLDRSVCLGNPMILPALTGLPMINGLPPARLACNLGKHYSYSYYGAESMAAEVTDAELCKKALRLGFSRLGVIGSASEYRRLNCAQ